jgi:hypothetical protein
MYRCSFLTPGLRDVYDEQLRLLASEQRIKVEKKEAKKNGWSGGGEDGGETFMFGDVELVVVPYVANSLFKLWDLQRQLPDPCFPCLAKGSIDDRKKAHFFLDVEAALDNDPALKDSLARLYKVVLRKNDLDSNVSRTDFERFHNDMVAAIAVGTGWRGAKPTLTVKSWPVWRDPEGKPVHSEELDDIHYNIPEDHFDEAMAMGWERMHHAMPDNEFSFETFAKFMMTLCECWMADPARVPTSGPKPEYLEYCVEIHGRLINTMYKRHVMEPFDMELFLQLDLNTTGRIDLPNLKDVAKMMVDAGHISEVPSFDELSVMIEAVSDDPERIGGCGYMFFEHMMKNRQRTITAAWDTWWQHTEKYKEKQRQESIEANYSEEQQHRMEELERARHGHGGGKSPKKAHSGGGGLGGMVMQGTTARMDKRASVDMKPPVVKVEVRVQAQVEPPSPLPIESDNSTVPMPIDIAPVVERKQELMRVQTPEFMPRSPPGRPQFQSPLVHSPPRMVSNVEERSHSPLHNEHSYLSGGSSVLPQALPSLKVVVKKSEGESRAPIVGGKEDSSLLEGSMQQQYGRMDTTDNFAIGSSSDLKLSEMEHYTLGMGMTGMPSEHVPEAESGASFFAVVPKAVVPKPVHNNGRKPNHSSKFNSHLGSGGGGGPTYSRSTVFGGSDTSSNSHDQRRIVSARPYNTSSTWNVTASMKVTAPVLGESDGTAEIDSMGSSGSLGSAERARAQARAQLSATQSRVPQHQQPQSNTGHYGSMKQLKRRSASAQPRRHPNFSASKAVAAAEKVAAATWGKNKQNATGLLASASLPKYLAPKAVGAMDHLSADRRAKIDKIKTSLTMRSLAGV